MAVWTVEQIAPGGPDGVRFRIFPEGEPERWTVETNPNFPVEVQEEFALLIAELLSKLL